MKMIMKIDTIGRKGRKRELHLPQGNCSKTKTWIRFQSAWVTEPGPFLIITNMSPNYPIFREFFESLRLEWTDVIFVTILANHEVRVVVFDAIEDSERTFEWL